MIIREETLRFAAVLIQRPMFCANFSDGCSNEPSGDIDLYRRYGCSGVLVLPTNVNSRRKLHVRYRAIGRLRDLKDGYVELECRIV